MIKTCQTEKAKKWINGNKDILYLSMMHILTIHEQAYGRLDSRNRLFAIEEAADLANQWAEESPYSRSSWFSVQEGYSETLSKIYEVSSC